MQPPDSTKRGADEAGRAEVPDDIALGESVSVSTGYHPGTGRRLRRATLLAAGVLLLAFLIVLLLRFLDQRHVARAAEHAYSAPPLVDVVTARAARDGEDLILPAQSAAWYDATLYARVSGYVASWHADLGDHVKKGAVLAVIETPELDAELAAARASLRASQAQLAARRVESEFTKSTNERWRDSPKGVVSEQERESKKADFESARAREYAAEAQVALDKSRVDQYAALAEFKQVTAPFDGTVTERRIDVGNLVSAGSSSSMTPLFRISQTDPLRIFVDVPQSAADVMKAGLPAQIRAPNAVFAGKITRSAEALNAQTRTMRVEVDMPNADHALLPGMYVKVAFHLAPRGVVQIPAAAVIFRASGAQVAKIDAQGRVQFTTVSIARDDGNEEEVSSGVAPGERLVLNISSQIEAGQRVVAKDLDAHAPGQAAGSVR